MGYDEPCDVARRPYEVLTDRLHKALSSIDSKTKAFQVSANLGEIREDGTKTPSFSEFEDRLRIIVEKAEEINVKLKF